MHHRIGLDSILSKLHTVPRYIQECRVRMLDSRINRIQRWCLFSTSSLLPKLPEWIGYLPEERNEQLSVSLITHQFLLRDLFFPFLSYVKGSFLAIQFVTNISFFKTFDFRRFDGIYVNNSSWLAR